MTTVTLTEIGSEGVFSQELFKAEACEHSEHNALHWSMATLAVADELIHTTEVASSAMIMAMWLAHDGYAPFEFTWLDAYGITYTWRYDV